MNIQLFILQLWMGHGIIETGTILTNDLSNVKNFGIKYSSLCNKLVGYKGKCYLESISQIC